MLQEAFDKVSARASQIQEQYKNVSVQLVQAKMVLKNYGEMQAADAMLIAQASEHSGPHSDNASVPRGPSGPPSEASGRSHATHSSAPIAGALSSISEFPPGPDGLGGSHPTSANPGTVPTTNSIAELSRTDPSAAGCNLSGPGAPRSEAGSTSSSVASYLPRRAGRAAQGGAEKQATGEDSSPLHMSAQLANSQLKARLQQQRADAAESRERLLQRRLAEMEAAAAAGDTPAGAADNRLDVLKACPLLALRRFPTMLWAALARNPAMRSCGMMAVRCRDKWRSWRSMWQTPQQSLLRSKTGLTHSPLTSHVAPPGSQGIQGLHRKSQALHHRSRKPLLPHWHRFLVPQVFLCTPSKASQVLTAFAP